MWRGGMKNARVMNEIPHKGNEKCSWQGMKNVEGSNEKPHKGNEKCPWKGIKKGMKKARARNEKGNEKSEGQE
jgi:hypothetical protein